MNYRSVPEMKQIWHAYMVRGSDASSLLSDETFNAYFIKGDAQTALKNQQEYLCSGLYQYLERRDRIHSSAPEDFVIESMNGLFYYLKKQLGIQEPLVATTVKQAREHMYTLADIIDKQEV